METWGLLETMEITLMQLVLKSSHISGMDQTISLGCMYAIGQCVEKSHTKAREWLKKAAAQEDEVAITALKTLDEIEGRTTTTSEEQAVVSLNPVPDPHAARHAVQVLLVL